MKIVITGSSSGIGKSIAEFLLQRGDHVWGIARRNQSEIYGHYGDQFKSTSCDVSSWDEVSKASLEINKVWKSADGLIACAGIQGEIGRALSSDPLKWEKTLTSNLSGTYFSIRGFYPLIASSKNRGKIICFSGGGASKARLNFSAYAAAKTGIVRLVETIAEEERGTSLDINAIAPGSINTRLTEEIIELGPALAGEIEYHSALKQKKDGGQPISKTIALIEWLLSPLSNGISGKILSAQWDNLETLASYTKLDHSDLFTLRRTLPGLNIK